MSQALALTHMKAIATELDPNHVPEKFRTEDDARDNFNETFDDVMSKRFNINDLHSLRGVVRQSGVLIDMQSDQYTTGPQHEYYDAERELRIVHAGASFVIKTFQWEQLHWDPEKDEHRPSMYPDASAEYLLRQPDRTDEAELDANENIEGYVLRGSRKLKDFLNIGASILKAVDPENIAKRRPLTNYLVKIAS